MYGTIKKKLQLHIYIEIQIILFLSFIFFILISFGYTLEFTIFFYWIFYDLFILNSSSFAPHYLTYNKKF